MQISHACTIFCDYLIHTRKDELQLKLDTIQMKEHRLFMIYDSGTAGNTKTPFF